MARQLSKTRFLREEAEREWHRWNRSHPNALPRGDFMAGFIACQRVLKRYDEDRKGVAAQREED